MATLGNALRYPSDFFPRAPGKNQQPLTSDQQKLVTDNIGLALKAAKSLCILELHRSSEARAEAMLALCQAAQSYDPDQGATFSTWAFSKCRWHLLRWLENQNKAKRRYISVAEPELTASSVGSSSAVSPEQAAHDAAIDARVRQSLENEPRAVQAIALELYAPRRETPSNRQMAAALGTTTSLVERDRETAKRCLNAIIITSNTEGKN